MLTLFPPAPNGLCTPEALAAAIWVDVLDPTPEEVALASTVIGFDTPSREMLSEIETSSRLQVEGDTLRLSAPLLAHAETLEQTLTPVGFIVSPRRLVTIRYAQMRVFDGVHVRAEAGEGADSSSIFTLLLEAVVDRNADLLEHIATELEALSHSIFRPGKGRRAEGVRDNESLRNTLTSVGLIGDRLSEIRASLLGVGRIAPFAQHVAPWLAEGRHARLAAVRQDIASLDDFEGHLETKVQFLLDAVLGFINTQQNELFKILTIVSVVGVPPTLFASIWGMNFRHMPELEWPMGYPMAVVLILASAVLPMLWFKWKRWW